MLMYFVLDIGGTFIKYALMNSAGDIVSKNKTPVQGTSLQELQHTLYSIVDAQNLEDIKGIALSCPGTIDVETGMVYYGGSFPSLHQVNLIKLFEDRYHMDVSVENDGKCAALAELWLGSVKDVKDSVVLVLGTAIGGGIIINGELHRGKNLSAGEVSYVMSNMSAITQQATFFGLECSTVKMIEEIGALKGMSPPISGEAVFDYINAEDTDAMQIFDQYCWNIATQILNLQYILDPELFAIGGGISAQPIVIKRINWAISEIKKQNPFHVASPQITACTFRNDANLYGALYNFFLRHEKKQKQR